MIHRLARLRRRAPIGDFALILLFGLVPLLWFREGKLLVSEDLMVPPNWEEFSQFWYVWNDQLGTGAQKILDSGRFPTLFIAAALQGLGVSLVHAQMIQFVFWFTLPGFSMYYLVAVVYRGEFMRLARLAAVLFYMFNLWQISNWLGYKEPVIAAMAVLPFVIGIWVRTLSAETGYIRAVLISSLVSLAASPIGNNVSEMFVALIPVPLLFLTVALAATLRGCWVAMRRLLLAGLALTLLLPLLHAFWIVPEFVGIISAQDAGSFPEFQRVSHQFLEGQSLYTSITNNILFLSDWTWYQGLVDPYRSYSAGFTGSPAMKLLGWTVFGLVLVGAIRGQGKYRGYFILLVVTGLIASAGLNSPVGSAYAWAFDNLPFFWIVRSPWFKFSLLTVLGYAVLIGLSAPVVVRVAEFVLVRIVGVWSARAAARSALVCAFALFLAAGPLYAYPFTLGLSFATADERSFLNPNHAEPPSYVYETANWLNDQPGDFRFMTIPGDSPWLSDWGYSSWGSFLQTLTPAAAVFVHAPNYVHVSTGAPDASGPATLVADQDLLDQRSEDASHLLARMGVGYVVHERDVRYDFYRGAGYREDDSPANVARALGQQAGVALAATFGRWDVYSVSTPLPRIWPALSLVAVDGLTAKALSRFLGSDWFDDNGLFVDSDTLTLEAIGSVGVTVSGTDPQADVLVVDTADLADHSPLRPVLALALEMGDLSDWDEEETLTPGTTWRWMKTNLGDHYLVMSGLAVPESAELRLNVISYARERSFYVYLNEELVSLETVQPDIPTAINVSDLQLLPGRNVVSFYTPYPADPRNGINASFAIEQSPQLGRAVFEWSPPVPAAGEYAISITTEPVSTDGWPWGIPDEIHLDVDGRDIGIARRPGRKAQFEGTLNLHTGSVIRINRLGLEDYFVMVRMPGRTTLASPPPEVTYSRIDPTEYMVAVRTSEPFILVFNESFDAGWTATIEGQDPLPHFQADSYSNAYVIDNVGEFEIALEYGPQRYFELAVMVSALGFLFAVTALLVFRTNGQKQPARPSEPNPSAGSGQTDQGSR